MEGDRVLALYKRIRSYLQKNGAQKKATLTRLAYRVGYSTVEIERAYTLLQEDVDVGYWFDMNTSASMMAVYGMSEEEKSPRKRSIEFFDTL